MRYLAALCVLMLGVVFCNAQTASNDTIIQQITLDTLEVSVPAGPVPYRGAAPRVWEIKNTRVALSFNWKDRTANAREWITIHPYAYATDTLVLDAKGMEIDSVLLSGKTGNTKLKYTYENNELKIRFGRAYKPSETIELYLRYVAMPYGSPTGGSGAIADDRGLYFVNTDYSIPHKPAQIWTQGETESNSHWMITIDKPNTRFTTQVELTVPDSMVTLGNGAMVKQVKGTNGTRTDIWKMDKPIQAYAVMFAIGKFSIVKKRWKEKEVNYYVEPEFAPYAAAMFNNTPEMIDFFSKRTGVPYPWNKYSQVVVRDYVSGAMENTSASLFGEFMNQNLREIVDKNSEDVVSHELFHQWFGDYVTCKSWSNITVNESFANYGEQLWRTFKYGKASGDELAYGDLQIYTGYSQYNDPQLVRYNYDSREEVFDPISYNKGGAILRYLNHLIGDSAFDKAMNIYLTKNALHSAEAHNWRMAVEEATGQDYGWFFDEWYYHAGHPVLKVVYDYNDTTQKLTVTVSQAQSDSPYLYRLPLKAAVIYGNNVKVIDWNINRKKETFVYDYKNGEKPVIVPDYTHVMPGELKDTKKPPQWKVQFMLCNDFVSKKLALSAAGKLISDTNSQAIIDMALADGNPSIRRLGLAQIKNTQSDKYHKRWTGPTEALANNDTSNLVRSDAFEVLGEWKVASAKDKMLMALYNNSYTIAGSALDALYRIDKDTAYTLARKLLDTEPRGNLQTAAWTIIGKKGADEDVALYEKYGPYVFGNKRFSFAYSLNSYLKNVKNDASFRRGVEVYTTLVNTESMKAYRSMMGGMLFQVATEQKDNAQSAKKEEAEEGKMRLSIVKSYLQKVIALEKDPETLKEYEKKMKTTFE
jgi:aminopeptidase N